MWVQHLVPDQVLLSLSVINGGGPIILKVGDVHWKHISLLESILIACLAGHLLVLWLMFVFEIVNQHQVSSLL